MSGRRQPRSYYLLLELGVLHAEILLVEVVRDGLADAAGADGVLERPAHGDVLAPDLVVLHAQEGVARALVLRLLSSIHRTSSRDSRSNPWEINRPAEERSKWNMATSRTKQKRKERKNQGNSEKTRRVPSSGCGGSGTRT